MYKEKGKSEKVKVKLGYLPGKPTELNLNSFMSYFVMDRL